MKEIEKAMVRAIRNNEGFKRDNTQVSKVNTTENGYCQYVWLFDNRIATLHFASNGLLSHIDFSMCGWGSVTTRSRLNALFNLFIPLRPLNQSKGVQHFDDMPLAENARYRFTLQDAGWKVEML